MKVKLTRAARIRHNAGEIVEVSPAEAGFLISTGSAVKFAGIEEPVKEVPERCIPVSAEMPDGAETPEGNAASAETPEKAAAKKTTKKKSTK